MRWSRIFYCPRGGFFHDVVELEDERISLVGQRVNEQGLEQGWYLKLTPDGARVSEKIFENAGFHSLQALAACTSGGLLLGGLARGDTGPKAKGRTDLWLYRLDAQGNIMWRNTYGGPNFEQCVDVIEARKGLYYVLGQKENDFHPDQGSKGKDFWLLRIKEYPCEYLQASIFVRAKNNRIPRDLRVRFRANHTFATSFSWDFGDGTISEDQDPLKSYRLPGMYQPRLTVYANEGCWRTVKLPKPLVVE